MSDTSPSAAAIHEAGHAVACLLSGGRVPTVTIEKDGTGLTTTQLPAETSGFHFPIVAIAGPVAEARHVGGHFLDCVSDGDLDNLADYASGRGMSDACLDEMAESSACCAKAMFDSPISWQAVETLAKRLDNERTIHDLTIENLATPAIAHRSAGFEKLQKAAAMLWGEGGEYP